MTTPHTILAKLESLAAATHGDMSKATACLEIQAIATELRSILPKTGEDRTAGISSAVSEDLTRRFTYHAPKPGQPEIYTELRREAHNLALLIAQKVPAGREMSLAVTKIEEAIFWANAGIARHG